MGLRDRLAGLIMRSTSPENPSVPLAAVAKWLSSGNQTVSGESMNEAIALRISTVYTCVRVLAESIASLPCVLFEKTSLGQRKEAVDHPLHYILGVEPNDEMSAYSFWSTIVSCMALTGNAYAEIMWTKDGNTVGEIYPLSPLLTEPFRQAITGKLIYRTKQGVVQDPQKPTAPQWRYINQEDMLHFKLFSLDGVKGLSPIQQLRESFGLTRAAEKFGAKLFGNGSKPGGVLSGPEKIDEKLLAIAKTSWEASQGGSNQGRTAVLPGEWKYQQIGLSPEDSQFLATRAFQRADIAAAFRVPAHMAGDTSKISNNSFEQMNLSFVNDTLRPLCVHIEAECNRKLMHQLGRKAGKYFVKFDFSERLRADHETTMKGIALGRQWGLMTVNEGRTALGMNPLSAVDGDSRLVPVNMMNSTLIPAQKQVPNGAPGGGNEPTEEEPPVKPKKTSVDSDPEDTPEPVLED